MGNFINPVGDIWLCHDVPLTPDYTHTIYFPNDTAQMNYFKSKTILNSSDNPSLSSQNYVKSENGKIRVEVKPNTVQDVSYAVIENAAIGRGSAVGNTDRIFVFITNIDVVSPNVVELTYKVDVIQTYVVQFGLNHDTNKRRVGFKQCFIDRRHFKNSRTNPTVNLEPESIPISKKLVSNASAENTDNKLLGEGFNTLLVFTSDYIDYNEEYASDTATIAEWLGDKHGGLLQGCFVEVVKATDRKKFLEYILTHANKAEAIVGMMAVPDTMVNSKSSDILLLKDDGKYIHTGSITLSNWNKGMDGVEEDKIKNKKLFTAPYNTLILTDGSTQTELEFEYLGSYQTSMDDSVELSYDTVLSIQPDAQIQFLLKNYGKNGNTPNYNMITSLLLDNLQHVPWNSDAFSQWLANNGISTGVNALTSIGSGALAGFAMGGPAGAVLGGLGGGAMSLGSAVASGGTAALKPATVNGKSSALPLMAAGEYDIHAMRYSLSREDVERIDDYFTTFGYACNRLGSPFEVMEDVITSTDSLNQCYIKTSACLAYGNCPAEYLREIEGIFNAGITWWKSDKVGHYN